MRTPRGIYAQYNIMPSLQLHQLRVAAVAQLICDKLSSEGGSASGGQKRVNSRDVILACLFHDMGNIIKFKLGALPELVEPEGVEYWEKKKAEYIQKYGNDEHTASEQIAKEIGLSEAVLVCIDSIKFSKAEEISLHGSFEQKICEYADSRVGPTGVLSLEERLADTRKRYLDQRPRSSIAGPQDRFEILMQAERDIEKQIFESATIEPTDITDAAVSPLIEKLREYPID